MKFSVFCSIDKSIACLPVVALTFFMSFGSARATASETKSPVPAKAETSGQNLPLCVNDTDRLKQVDEQRRLNSKTKFKYKAIQEALASDSNEELAARLVYAETIAANCPDLRNEVMAPIAAVIQNRIAKRNGDTQSVVFQIDQFASSLNGYGDSKWREFMCPTDLGLWRQALTATRNASRDLSKNPNAIPGDVFNYYLFQHSPTFTVPVWAQKNAVSFAGSEKIADCLKLFKGSFK